MTSTTLLALAVFGACTVESVEALTLVLAAGVARGWRSAFEGAVAAIVVLAVLVVAIGIPAIRYVPIDVLRVVIGALLLVLGLGWLRKAVLRASGHKALHDEDAIYESTVTGLGTASPAGRRGRNAVGFAIAFKGVFLEGTEVILIVLSLGASSHHLFLACVMALAAALTVTCIGAVVARQLREVPENALKFGVGVMLTSFGLFWLGEGCGLAWPGSDLMILAFIAGLLLLAFTMTRWLSGVPATQAKGHGRASSREPVTAAGRALRAFGGFWMDLLVGDTPEIFLGTLVVVASALLLRHDRVLAIGIVVALTALLLAGSAYRGARPRQAQADA